MKKLILLCAVSLLALGASAENRKGEILYFKAELPCCPARACNALEQDVRDIIKANFEDGSVTFRQVALADEANKPLVTKYKAKSQTVVLVLDKEGEASHVDLSDIVHRYARSNDKEKFTSELVAKIKASI